MDSFEIIVIILILSFIGSLFTGFPIAWLLGGISVLFAAGGILLAEYTSVDVFFMDRWASFTSIIERIYALMENWTLVALPMFIFMGLMLDRSGIAEKLVSNFVKVFGQLRGGLALSVVFIGVLLAASTGIVGASVVLLAILSLPLMMQANYSKSLAAAVVASSGTLGILIPPSIMLVIMSDQIGLSVGDLFMGAVIPGVLLGALYAVYIIILGFVRPDMAPPPPKAASITWRDIAATLLSVVPPLVLILAVLGSIFFGVATPTEASGIGAMGATLLALVNRRLDVETVRRVCRETMKTTAFIFGIFLGATAFALVLRLFGGDEFIGGLLKGLPLPPEGIIVVILLVAFIAGFFLDWLEISLIILPLVAPVVRELGFDLVWFTVLFAVCLQTSFITPPVGFSLFYLKGVAPPEITVGHIYRGVVPFVLLQLLALALVFLFEDLVLWLPGQMYRQ